MRVAVMGTGGVGGYFGARLAGAGHEVAFIARGRQLEALRAKGLRVESPLGDLHLPAVEVTDQPAEIGPVDLVLFTVKLWDTLEAAESVKPLLGEGSAVVSFQNGVVKDDILRDALGAGLASAGHEVAFVARGRQLEALRAKGLRVESPLGDLHLPTVEVTDQPAEIGPVDLVLFTVKLWDTLEAAESVKPLLGGNSAVVSFQNGVVKDDILRDALGAGHVIGGVTYIAATIAEPGVIRHSGTLQKLVFGEYDGSLSPRVRQFRDACADSGIDAETSEKIEQTVWEKFVFLVGLSGTTSVARSPIGPIRSNPRSRAFLHDVMLAGTVSVKASRSSA